MLLPVELIDHIFSFLQKDSSALKACSKAHRSLSRVAERHLYAHIIIPEICNHEDFLENPHLLDYPRTLEFRIFPSHTFISQMQVIPRLANLVCLKIYGPQPTKYERFISMLRNCLQQSSLQELLLSHIYVLQFSIFDDAKYIKHLTFSDCTGNEEEQISSSPSSQLSLETLILSGYFNPCIGRRATRLVTSLTSLELKLGVDWIVFPELLVACSNSLTKLHLDMNTRYLYGERLPFTLTTLVCLERLSISAFLVGNLWSLPEIIQLANTAPATPDVVLRFDFHPVTAIHRFDWSILGRLQSDLTGKRPRINLCVAGKDKAGHAFSSGSIRDALAKNEALMDLVEKGLVILGS